MPAVGLVSLPSALSLLSQRAPVAGSSACLPSYTQPVLTAPEHHGRSILAPAELHHFVEEIRLAQLLHAQPSRPALGGVLGQLLLVTLALPRGVHELVEGLHQRPLLVIKAARLVVRLLAQVLRDIGLLVAGPRLLTAELDLPGVSGLFLNAGGLAGVNQSRCLCAPHEMIDLATLLVDWDQVCRYGFVGFLGVLLRL